MGICIYCIDKSADTLYLEKGANRCVQAVGNILQSEINSWSHIILVWCAVNECFKSLPRGGCPELLGQRKCIVVLHFLNK